MELARIGFKRPINYPGTVQVRGLCAPPGGSSVQTFYIPERIGSLLQ
jgi:hypothetical protein